MGTWGRCSGCRGDAHARKQTLEKTTGIAFAIPVFFVPTSPSPPNVLSMHIYPSSSFSIKRDNGQSTCGAISNPPREAVHYGETINPLLPPDASAHLGTHAEGSSETPGTPKFLSDLSIRAFKMQTRPQLRDRACVPSAVWYRATRHVPSYPPQS